MLQTIQTIQLQDLSAFNRKTSVFIIIITEDHYLKKWEKWERFLLIAQNHCYLNRCFISPLMSFSDATSCNQSNEIVLFSLENIAIIVISIHKSLMNVCINTVICILVFSCFFRSPCTACKSISCWKEPENYFPVRLVSSRTHHWMELIDMEWRMEE